MEFTKSQLTYILIALGTTLEVMEDIGPPTNHGDDGKLMHEDMKAMFQDLHNKVVIELTPHQSEESSACA